MIIILGCILLGAYIFFLLLRDNDSSFKNTQKKVFEYEINSYSPIP